LNLPQLQTSNLLEMSKKNKTLHMEFNMAVDLLSKQALDLEEGKLCFAKEEVFGKAVYFLI
jgi:hypothetical protein